MSLHFVFFAFGFGLMATFDLVATLVFFVFKPCHIRCLVGWNLFVSKAGKSSHQHKSKAHNCIHVCAVRSLGLHGMHLAQCIVMPG